ncbi:hypothetical protein CYMTET_27399 [Cymbomonas tetramitiformis]|uniref:Uncharacterized protein n=1 Tax=Cymbomonas tetramitiformis TaxID=36881 RepID=A0AAE0KWY6_9CHLO|nr:hypothetical protein CYMTET_27399 [Cymbomonas tetramitiformis]
MRCALTKKSVEHFSNSAIKTSTPFAPPASSRPGAKPLSTAGAINLLNSASRNRALYYLEDMGVDVVELDLVKVNVKS